MSEPEEPRKVEVLPPGFRVDTAKSSFLQGYLKKAGKITAFMAIIGCLFMMFAAWMITSTFERILSAASAPMPIVTPGK